MPSKPLLWKFPRWRTDERFSYSYLPDTHTHLFSVLSHLGSLRLTRFIFVHYVNCSCSQTLFDCLFLCVFPGWTVCPIFELYLFWGFAPGNSVCLGAGQLFRFWPLLWHFSLHLLSGLQADIQHWRGHNVLGTYTTNTQDDQPIITLIDQTLSSVLHWTKFLYR